MGTLTLQHHQSCRERHGSTKQDQLGLQKSAYVAPGVSMGLCKCFIKAWRTKHGLLSGWKSRWGHLSTTEQRASATLWADTSQFCICDRTPECEVFPLFSLSLVSVWLEAEHEPNLVFVMWASESLNDDAPEDLLLECPYQTCLFFYNYC